MCGLGAVARKIEFLLTQTIGNRHVITKHCHFLDKAHGGLAIVTDGQNGDAEQVERRRKDEDRQRAARLRRPGRGTGESIQICIQQSQQVRSGQRLLQGLDIRFGVHGFSLDPIIYSPISTKPNGKSEN